MSSWGDHALAGLSAAGLRRGGARRTVVEFLDEQRCCLSAQEIHDGVRAAGRLEARDAVAHVDPLDEAQGGERLERPVDARDADGAAGGADAVMDLLCGEAAPLLVEELDDRPACAPAAEPGGAEAGERVVGPARHSRK